MPAFTRRTHTVDAERVGPDLTLCEPWAVDAERRATIRRVGLGFLVFGNGHETLARPGDWIVKHGNGDLGTLKHHDFVRTYEAVP